MPQHALVLDSHATLGQLQERVQAAAAAMEAYNQGWGYVQDLAGGEGHRLAPHWRRGAEQQGESIEGARDRLLELVRLGAEAQKAIDAAAASFTFSDATGLDYAGYEGLPQRRTLRRLTSWRSVQTGKGQLQEQALRMQELLRQVLSKAAVLAYEQGWGYYEAAEQKAAVPIPIVLSAYWKKGAAQPEDDWEDKSFRLAEIVERDAKARAAAGPHNFESYAEEAAGSALPHFWRKGYQAPGLVEAAERLQELCAKEANRRAAVADAAVNAFNVAHSYAEHSAERKATRKSLAIWRKAAQPVSLADAPDRLAELCSKPAVAEAMKKEAAVVAGTLQYAQATTGGSLAAWHGVREVALDAQDAAERLAELRAKDARAAAADAAVHAFNTHMNYTQATTGGSLAAWRGVHEEPVSAQDTCERLHELCGASPAGLPSAVLAYNASTAYATPAGAPGRLARCWRCAAQPAEQALEAKAERLAELCAPAASAAASAALADALAYAAPAGGARAPFWRAVRDEALPAQDAAERLAELCAKAAPAAAKEACVLALTDSLGYTTQAPTRGSLAFWRSAAQRSATDPADAADQLRELCDASPAGLPSALLAYNASTAYAAPARAPGSLAAWRGMREEPLDVADAAERLRDLAATRTAGICAPALCYAAAMDYASAPAAAGRGGLAPCWRKGRLQEAERLEEASMLLADLLARSSAGLPSGVAAYEACMAYAEAPKSAGAAARRAPFWRAVREEPLSLADAAERLGEICA